MSTPGRFPKTSKRHLDLTSGRDRGRIYRLVPPSYRPGFVKPARPRLGDATTQQLVKELENPNSWWRQTAQRLLFERQDASAVPALRRLLSDSSTIVARVNALWSLAGLDGLRDEDLLIALADSSPRVRHPAVQLAEERLASSPRLADAVLEAAEDRDVYVRFQVACTLGELEDDRKLTALTRIARSDGQSQWTRAAVLSALGNNSSQFLFSLLADEEFSSSRAGVAMIQQLFRMVGSSESAEIVAEAVAKMPPAVDVAARQRLSEFVMSLGAGLQRSGRSLSDFVTGDSSTGRAISELISNASILCATSSASAEQRMNAVQLVGYAGFPYAQRVLSPLIDPRQPQEIQILAIDALSSYRDGMVAETLLMNYGQLTPTVRKRIVRALLARHDRLPALVKAVSNGVVSPTVISQSQRRRILASGDDSMAALARAAFAGDSLSPRKDVIDRYRQALSLSPDRTQGEAVFRRECLSCHRLDDTGYEVGPSLSTVRHRSAAEVLVHIPDPNREVSPNFLEYVLVTVDGRIVTGVIVAETANTITVRSAEGKEELLQRSDMDEVKTSGKSLMPEGLERKISPQEMASLLEFVLESGRVR